LKTKSRTKTELLKVSGARRRARQAALDALLAEGKVIRIDKEYFANDPSGSVEEVIHAEAVRLDAYLRCVPELSSRSGKKLRRAMKDNALASVAFLGSFSVSTFRRPIEGPGVGAGPQGRRDP